MENRHHLATGHSEFAVPTFLCGSFFQGMTLDYGVVFFQEFVDDNSRSLQFFGGNHCWVRSLFLTY